MKSDQEPTTKTIPCPVCRTRHPQGVIAYRRYRGLRDLPGDSWRLDPSKPGRIFFRCFRCAEIISTNDGSAPNGYIKDCYGCPRCKASLTNVFFEEYAKRPSKAMKDRIEPKIGGRT